LQSKYNGREQYDPSLESGRNEKKTKTNPSEDEIMTLDRIKTVLIDLNTPFILYIMHDLNKVL